MNQSSHCVLNRLRELASANTKRVVFPESQDRRVIEAAIELDRQGLAVPLLIGVPTCALPSQIQLVAVDDRELRPKCAAQLFQMRKHRGLSSEAAELAVEDPLLFAATLVGIGFADASVAGSIATTASVIRAGLYGVGTKPGLKLVSSFFLMQFPEFCLTYADCGVVPEPDERQLAEIAISAADNHRLLTGDLPRVAMLSFSTKGSAEHSSVEKVRQATRIAADQRPDLLIDGELQFDAAFVPEVAARKSPQSAVAGRANVFIFPDLNSGNIAYKVSERLGGATALGPLVQGLARPCMDLSRGCSVQNIIDVAVIASVVAQASE